MSTEIFLPKTLNKNKDVSFYQTFSCRTIQFNGKNVRSIHVQESGEDVPVQRCGDFDKVLVVVQKNADEYTKEHKRANNFDKYMLRCQKKQVDGGLSNLRTKYPNLVVLEPRCDDGNAIHMWNRLN